MHWPTALASLLLLVISACRPAPLGAPTAVVAVSEVGGVEVRWAPVTSKGDPILDYTVTAHPSGETVTATMSPVTVPGLVEGNCYTFTVHARTPKSVGLESIASNPAAPRGPPCAPRIVSATSELRSAIIRLEPPEHDGGSTITSYLVTARTSDPRAPLLTVRVVPQDDVIPEAVLPVEQGTTYSLTAHATNNRGPGPESAPSIFTLMPSTSDAGPTLPAPDAGTSDAGSPVVRTSVYARAGESQASVRWSENAADGGTTFASYTVTASPGGAVVTTKQKSAVIYGLENGTAYTFNVRAKTSSGDEKDYGTSNPVRVSCVESSCSGTLACDIGTGLCAPVCPNGESSSCDSCGSIDGSGCLCSAGGYCYYHFECPFDCGAGYHCDPDGPHCVFDYDAAPRCARSGDCDYDPTKPICDDEGYCDDIPGMPQWLSVVISGDQATLSWLPPEYDGESPITGYTITQYPGGAQTNVGLVTTATLTGLSLTADSSFRVRATNARGAAGRTSSASAAVPGVIDQSWAEPRDRSAFIRWQAPESWGGAPLTEYVITASPSGATRRVPATETSGTISGLTNGIEYSFRVKAVNPYGAGPEHYQGPATRPQPPLLSPTVLASGQHNPTALQVDASNLYWVTNEESGAVLRLPKAGGTPTTLAAGRRMPMTTALDATNLYWAELGQRILWVPTAGGNVVPVTSTSLPLTASLTQQGFQLFWNTTDSIGTVQKAGGVADVLSGGDQLRSLVATPTALYWTRLGVLSRMPLATRTGETVAGPYMGAIAVDGNFVYFVSNQKLSRFDLVGGETVSLCNGWIGASQIRVVGDSVFWAEYNKIVMCPKTGGVPTPLVEAPSNENVGSFVVDDSRLYWAEPESGKINSVPY